jgi:hypothetical protein
MAFIIIINEIEVNMNILYIHVHTMGGVYRDS